MKQQVRGATVSQALLVSFAGVSSAQDGAALYKEICAACHDAGIGRAPSPEALRAMSPERVLAALEAGVMISITSARTAAERRAVAEFVTGKSFSQALETAPSPQAMCPVTANRVSNPLAGPLWNGWGVNTSNTRLQDGAMAGFTAAQVPRLKLSWAFGFPGDVGADAQPTIAGGRVFVGSQSGNVYSLSAATGCIHWFFQAAAPVRAAVTIGRIDTRSGRRYAAFIGDRAANVYAVDVADGKLLWKTKVDNFPIARVTGSPVFHNGRLSVGVASGEETAGAPADYECCRFRGSLVALNASTGAQVWKTYTITEDVQPTKKNKAGTAMWGPSGAPIWTSPAVDERRNALYVTTGDNYSDPPTKTSDAFMALDLRSGKILWSRQMTVADAWNTACRLPEPTNCPASNGPDFDFASPPILVTLPSGRRALWRARNPASSMPSIPIGTARCCGRCASARVASTAAFNGVLPRTNPMSTWRCPTSAGFRSPTAWPLNPTQRRAEDCSRCASTPASGSGTHPRRRAVTGHGAVPPSPRRSVAFQAWSFRGRLTGIYGRSLPVTGPLSGISTRSGRTRRSTRFRREGALSTAPVRRSPAECCS